jgi:hypothetical protein
MSELLHTADSCKFPLQQEFVPSNDEIKLYGNYSIQNPSLLAKPMDVADDQVAYNPSSIWTVHEKSGIDHDVLYVRVEPNRSNSESSHLGRSFVRPYIVNPHNPEAPLVVYHGAQEYVGEDAALTRINRRLPISNALEEVWLLSFVDPKPVPDRPNEVSTLYTQFWAGPDLSKLEHVANGPEWMKDIRIASADGPKGTELAVYGRPQTEPDSGNITYTELTNIDMLSPQSIANAPYIDENLLPVGSGVWGGVNDIVKISAGKYVLAAHRAWRTGLDGHGRHYEAVLYGHDTIANRVIELGIIATADMFAGGVVKDDTAVDLKDVVFTGGGYNGGLDYMSFGVSDGNVGVAGIRREQL